MTMKQTRMPDAAYHRERMPVTPLSQAREQIDRLLEDRRRLVEDRRLLALLVEGFLSYHAAFERGPTDAEKDGFLRHTENARKILEDDRALLADLGEA